MKSFARLSIVKQLWAPLLAVFLFACTTDATPQVGVGPGGGSDGTRSVVVTDGFINFTTDAGSRPPLTVSTGNQDASQTDLGVMGSVVVDAMAPSCDLVTQNCEQNKACYRKSPNGTSCEIAGFATEFTTCAADIVCARGLVCVAGESGIAGCLPICDPQKRVCPDRRACRPLRGHEPAGYCEP